MPHSDKTIFHKILSGDIPASIVYEDEWVLAFKDIQPQSKIHVLVVPKKPARSMKDLTSWTEAEVGAFFMRVSKVAEKLELFDSGFRVVLNTGSDGCQSVEYIHAHILGGEPLDGSFGAPS